MKDMFDYSYHTFVEEAYDEVECYLVYIEYGINLCRNLVMYKIIQLMQDGKKRIKVHRPSIYLDKSFGSVVDKFLGTHGTADQNYYSL